MIHTVVDYMELRCLHIHANFYVEIPCIFLHSLMTFLKRVPCFLSNKDVNFCQPRDKFPPSKSLPHQERPLLSLGRI